MSKTTLFLTIAATALLALGGLATTVAAQGDDDATPREKAKERREAVQEQRDVRKEKMDAAKDAWQDCKRAGRENVSLNESAQRRCMAEKSFFLNATHARREAKALTGAIAALERQIGRLEVREMHLEGILESGNFTGNQTAGSVQEAIEKIDAHQERLAEKLEKLQARLDALHEKWQSVRDHVKDRRQGEGDDGEDDGESGDGPSGSSAPHSASPSASHSTPSST